MSSKRFLIDAAIVSTLLFGLAGCGGGGSGDVATVSPGTDAGTASEQASSGDSFVATVLAFITGTSETTEPQIIDGISVSAPDDTQPQPIS